jgi:amino acid transporter
MKVSSFVSSLGAIVGTLLPMLFICILSAIWLINKNPSQIEFTWHALMPDLHQFNNLAFVSGVFFSLIGMEMSAVHAEEVKQPQRDYPKALFYSVIIILSGLILSSLAIAIVIPHKEISLVESLIQAFDVFFKAYHLQWLLPVMVFAIILSGLSNVSAWIIGPVKGLLAASFDGVIPPLFHKTNTKGVPVALLIAQGVLVTLLAGVFLLMPTVNSSYWLLSALTAQLALLFYILMFAAAIKLRYKAPDQKRTYKIPGGKLGIWIICGVAILACIAVIIFGFFPPLEIQVGNIYFYEGFLIAGIFIFCLIPFIIYQFRKPEWNNKKILTD